MGATMSTQKAHFALSLRALHNWNLEEPEVHVVEERYRLGPKYSPTLLHSYSLIDFNTKYQNDCNKLNKR